MKYRQLIMALSLLAFVGIMLATIVDQASAQEDWKEREGLGGLFDRKKGDDEGKGATTLQKAIGIGSIFVMIGVMKWL